MCRFAFGFGLVEGSEGLIFESESKERTVLLSKGVARVKEGRGVIIQATLDAVDTVNIGKSQNPNNGNGYTNMTKPI